MSYYLVYPKDMGMNDFKELGLNFLEYEDLLEAKNIDK